MSTEDTLGFAGIAPPTLRLYPIETHIAEKLHAYTLPRARPNSRLKDLPDLALLAGVNRSSRSVCAQRSNRHLASARLTTCPAALPEPPATWAAPYAAMAAEDQLEWATLADVTAAARAFLDPVLGGGLDLIWDPARRAWGRP